MKKLLPALMFVLILFNETEACVTFVLRNDNSLVFGWNYEFDAGSGFIIVNKTGLLKTSFLSQDKASITWISKYGSLTFNQWGKEFPSGGMNEKGLIVVQTMFIKAKYPIPDIRPAISELQWIQYQLDNFSTIQEVIENDKILRITNNSIPLHYMICDNTGNVAVIEFIDGKMICHKGSRLSIPVLANDLYEDSFMELNKYKGFGGGIEIPTKSTGPKSGNFIIASDFVKKYNKTENILDYSFETLSFSSEPKRTQWSVVFDIKNMAIHFRSFDNNKIKKIEFKNFDYTCNSTVKMLDVSTDNTDRFVDYNNSIDADYINRAYNNPAISWIKEVVPETVNNYKIKYISTIKCK